MRTWIKIHLALLLVVPPLLVGGVHLVTHAALGAWACLLAVLWSANLLLRPAAQRTVRWDGWCWLFLTAIVLTGLQLVPLPLSWLTSLSPSMKHIYQQTLQGVGVTATSHWQPLSLAPPETAAKLVRDVGALALFLVVLQWAHQRARVWWLLKVAVLGASGLALLVIAQAALGIRGPVWGLYQPRGPLGNPVVTSPFINANHMGAYHLFHALLALPLLVEAQSRRERLLWSACLVLLSVFTFLSMSRGAIIAYLLGLGAFGVLFWRERLQKPSRSSSPKDDDDTSSSSALSRRQHRSRRKASVLYLGLSLGLALGLAVALTFTGLRKEVSQTRMGLDQDKVGYILGHAAPLLQHYPWLGVGRGAMAMVWHRFAQPNTLTKGKFTVSHVESNLVQPLIDWGIPIGSLLVFAGLWLVFLLIRRTKGLLESSILIALLALLLQNVGDFNLEFIGTGYPFLIMLAALVRQQKGRAPSTSRRWPWLSATVGLVGLGLLAWLAPYAYAHQYAKLPQRWKAIPKQPASAFRQQLRTLARHHPSDYLLCVLVARHYTFHKPWKPLQALQWLDRGAALNPTAPDLILLRAYNLARLRLTSQAVQELDRALKLRVLLVRPAYALLRQFKATSAALRISKTESLVEHIHVQRSRQSKRPPTYARALQRSLKRFPTNLTLHKLLAQHRLQRWRRARQLVATTPSSTGVGPTAPEKSPAYRAYQRYKALQQTLARIPNTPLGQNYKTFLQAQIAETREEVPLATQLYQRVFAARQGEHWRAFQALFSLLLRHKSYDKARTLLTEAKIRYRSRNNWLRAHLLYLEGRLLQAQGHLRHALQRYELAVQRHGAIRYRIAHAQVCWEVGQLKCTLRIYRQLVTSTKNPHIKAQLKHYEAEFKKRKDALP